MFFQKDSGKILKEYPVIIVKSCLNSSEDFSHAQVDDLVISTMASLCSNLDTAGPLKKKVISQRRLAPGYNSQVRALKQTSKKLERKWPSSNLDFHLAWKEKLKNQ